jgi:acyl carrier protein
MAYAPSNSKSADAPAESPEIAERVRRVLKEHGRLGRDAGQMSAEDDLYEAGMTSLASVNVMLALEGEFGIEFPDQMLNRSVFASVAAICAAVQELNGV